MTATPTNQTVMPTASKICIGSALACDVGAREAALSAAEAGAEKMPAVSCVVLPVCPVKVT